MISLSVSLELFPAKRALISGFSCSANSLGPFILSPVLRYLVNPQGLPANIKVIEKGQEVFYFGKDVYKNIHFMINYYVFFLFILIATGTILMYYIEEKSKEFNRK